MVTATGVGLHRIRALAQFVARRHNTARFSKRGLNCCECVTWFGKPTTVPAVLRRCRSLTESTEHRAHLAQRQFHPEAVVAAAATAAAATTATAAAAAAAAAAQCRSLLMRIELQECGGLSLATPTPPPHPTPAIQPALNVQDFSISPLAFFL